MAKESYETFGEVRARLDEIVVEVRNKDLSLEKSLDLYEEAIKLGNRCAELVDKPDYTPEEAALASEAIEIEGASVQMGQLASDKDESPVSQTQE
jgi:exodeoxyribonuclease VII small subunit